MGEYKTPDIYIKEKNAFGDSIGDTMKYRIGSHQSPGRIHRDYILAADAGKPITTDIIIFN